jgi:hypothetical protein
MSVAHESLDDFLDEGMDKFLRYRWEFLRRNNDYKKHYQEMESFFRENDLSLNDYATVVYISAINIPFTDICLKWDIRRPFDPNRSYDEYYFEALRHKDVDTLHGLLAPTTDDPVCEAIALDFVGFEGLDLEEIDGRLTNKFLETKKCMIEINLKYSKARIIEAVKQLIDDRQSFLERKNALTKEDKYSTKKRYENYDYYLAVYDLKKAGKSCSQTRKALHMNGIESAEIQTAMDYYKAAKKLVKEGFSL